MLLSCLGRNAGSNLGRVGRAFAGTSKILVAAGGPTEHVAHLVGDGDYGVVERSMHMGYAMGDVFFSFFLTTFFPAVLDWVFAIAYLTYFFLPAMARRLPLRVRALVCVRCPRTGSPLRWRMPL